MPRIIAGSARGVPLLAPAGKDTRPTLDRTKEAMFSVIGSRLDFDGIRVLDLYAGSGQLGLEAVSRGAEFALLVEKSAKARQVIYKNIEKTKFGDSVKLIPGDVSAAVQSLITAGERFDLILLDPPYERADESFSALCRLGLANLLSPDGLLVLEHASRLGGTGDVTDLQLIKHCQYGSALVSFYRSRAA